MIGRREGEDGKIGRLGRGLGKMGKLGSGDGRVRDDGQIGQRRKMGRLGNVGRREDWAT